MHIIQKKHVLLCKVFDNDFYQKRYALMGSFSIVYKKLYERNNILLKKNEYYCTKIVVGIDIMRNLCHFLKNYN